MKPAYDPGTESVDPQQEEKLQTEPVIGGTGQKDRQHDAGDQKQKLQILRPMHT